MMERNFTMLISELAEEERKSAEEQIRMLHTVFRQCECYLRDYEAGEQNVFKLVGVMEQTRALIGDASSDLIERHRIADSPKGT